MSRVKDGNYIVIQSWMVKDLHLKGNELLIYAIIYGFSQDDQRFTGSLQYLADWTNCTRQAVIDNLKSLCNKGLLLKFEAEKNGVRFCEYQSKKFMGSQKSLPPSQESLPGGSQKSLPGGSQKSLPNNLVLDNLNIDKIEDTPACAGPPASPEPLASGYGAFSNVLITEDEYRKLQAAWPNDYTRAVDRFSAHLQKTGAEYPSHYMTLVSWLTQDTLRRNKNVSSH